MKGAQPDLAEIATTVQRLGVLLAAGTAPAAAWGYLDERGIAEQVARSASAGVPIPEAIDDAVRAVDPRERRIWCAVAAAWSVATDAGASLAPTLAEFAATIRDLAQSERDIAVALASPLATARLVIALPFVGLVFGTLLGFNTLGTLATTPIGWTCIVFGAGLLLTASRWNRRMMRRARPHDQTPGLQLDLLAIAVSGGGALDRARASVVAALLRYGQPEVDAGASVESVLDLSRRAGIPAAALLRSEAIEVRRVARSEVAERAQALSVRLMLPLGLCVLPAFMLLSVVPLLVTVLASTSIRL